MVSLLVALTGCPDNNGTASTASSAREPVVYKGPPPASAAEFQVNYRGEPLRMGEWELGVDLGRETRFTVLMTVGAAEDVCRVRFGVAPADFASEAWARELRDDPRTLGAGTYAYPLRWDGTGDGGKRLVPGRYTLQAIVDSDSQDCDGPNGKQVSRLGVLLLGARSG